LLIIFDLDDTLVDTSGCITPVKLKDALARMCEAGLSCGEMHLAESEMRRIDQTKLSSEETLKEFLSKVGADDRFLQIGLKEFKENLKIDMPVHQVEGAAEILDGFKETHTLALVTIGRRETQLEKLKKAGIDLSLFSRIAVLEEKNKKFHYQKIASELGFLPSEVIVCGDRIHIDLTPAKELGFKTVHIKRGRGLNSLLPQSDVDFTISQLSEMKDIIKNVKR
jgi:putative hydrolase of the HAD superfamily